jgi:hypothetical protein
LIPLDGGDSRILGLEIQDMQPGKLTSLQKEIIAAVGRYPGQFTRSSLSKMLVGAKSWKDKSYPEYRLFPGFGRKEMNYQSDPAVISGSE